MSEIVRVQDRARFGAPGVVGPAVASGRLGDRYAAATGRVLRVLAPGGYGKSTQIAQWVATDDRPVAWVDLRPVDNDPVVLAATLTQALSEAGGRLRSDSAMAPNASNGFAAAFVLVLDDVHHVHEQASLTLLAALAAHLPGTSTLVLSGRAQHGDWSTERLRLRPGVLDVTAADLALDAGEAEELLVSMGVDLGPEQLTRLAGEFEGWPAGLRLAGLVLGADMGAASTAPDDAADAALVVDYLRAEWTARLSPEHVRFLGEVACLRRFTGEMCDAILGRTESAMLLWRLQRDAQLLVPLDRRNRWFRMHTLLARWLASDLKEADPQRWRAIHVAAARWWERTGDIGLAVDHARLADDLALCEALVATHGPSYLTRGLRATVGGWYDIFSAEHLRSSPALCALGALNALHRGDGARAMQWSVLLERLVGAGDGGTLGTDPGALWACALRATLGPGRATGLSPLAEHAAGHLDGGPWHALAYLALGGLRFLTADRRAAESFAAGEFEADLAAVPLVQANCMAAGAVLAELDGDRARAADAGRRARALLVDLQVEHGPTTALVDGMHALSEARAGNHATAAAVLAAARRKLAGYDGVAPWYNVLARLPLARAALLIDDRATSRKLLQQIDLHLRTEPDDNGARDHLDVLRASIQATGRSSAGDGLSLTAAELRVLRYLPTNITVADIATRLYVSRNTVKTHISAIHRKLGAGSRSQTVGLARDAGLLDESAGLERD